MWRGTLACTSREEPLFSGRYGPARCAEEGRHLLIGQPVGRFGGFGWSAPGRFGEEAQKKGPSKPAAHSVSAYRCFLPDLAGFTVLSCAGPGPDSVFNNAVVRFRLMILEDLLTEARPGHAQGGSGGEAGIGSSLRNSPLVTPFPVERSLHCR